MPPAIKTLIIINVAVFVVQFFTPLGDFIFSQFSLWPVGTQNFRPWQPLTYMFLHGSGGHLFFNMFALWIFGTEIENYWGTKQFNLYYFICGIGAALINLLATIGDPYPTVGASGAIYGVLLAFGMMFPNRYIFLYFLFPIKAKYFVAGYAVIEFMSGLGSQTMGSGSNVAHFAHLGGMVIGYLYIMWKRQGWDAGELLQQLKKRKGAATIHRMPADERVSEEEIDAILDKISQRGYASLTPEERHKLLKAGGK